MNATTVNKNISSEVGSLVAYKLLVEGKPVSEALELVSINIHQEINVITKATIVIVDGDPDTKDFKISSSNQFSPGKTVEISIGYDLKHLLTTFKGIIVSNSQKNNNDCPMLTMECKDETVKMTLDKKSNHYEKKSATDIAEDFFHKYGFKFKSKKITPATFEHKQLVQFNNSDWDFLISKLDAANLMCILNNGEIIIKDIVAEPPKADVDKLVELEFGESIIEFNVDQDSRSQSEKVTVLTWNYTTQKIEKEDEETVFKQSNNNTVTVELEKGQTTTVRTGAKKEGKEQKLLALNKKNRKLLAKIRGDVKYFGKVEEPVWPGDFIKLKGIGDNFSAVIFVSAINHDFSDGDWTTTATLGWDDKYFTEQINPTHETSSSGELSTIQGLHSGIITDIIDNEGDFRVKLRLPIVDDQQDGVYARIATLDAGNNRGTFFMPELNDEVVVGFMNNDPNQPVVLGMLHSSKNAAPLDPEKANNKKGYVSRSKIKILIDDNEKSITIETPGGNVFSMNDTENKVELKDANGNKIIMEPEGITIEAAKVLTLKAGTSLSIAAPHLEMKADGEFKLAGGGTSTVTSDGIMNIKGSIVNIN
ncbi:MAG: type VI secretion system tip protein VgrG [Ginsengibacter sp.]